MLILVHYSVCYYSNSKYFASSSKDTSIRIWNTNSGQLSHTLSNHTSREVSTDKYVSGDENIHIWIKLIINY